MSWLVLRDIDIFPPDHHRSIICQRDLSFEVLDGHTERRHEYTIDCWTGKSFGRVGSGRYIKWASIPPSGMMLPANKLPPKNQLLIVCVTIPRFFGVKIGRFDSAWQIYSDILSEWIVVPSGYVEGWLPLI